MITPIVTVILVNYNCRKYVDALFQSLKTQTMQNFEVLVFNNKSEDGSLEQIKAVCPEAQIYEMGFNAGFSKPNNIGIRNARGKYVLCLNFDVVLEDEFIAEMICAIESESRVGWVAGKMLKLQPDGKSKNIDCLGHHMVRGRYAVESDYSKTFDWADYAVDRYVFGASACAALYKREMLEDIALNGEYFDEDFFAYYEDVDLDWRAQQRNWKCLFAPKAIGYHARYGTGLINVPHIAACYLANRIFMMLKNDFAAHFIDDFWPIFNRTKEEYLLYLKQNPQSVLLAIMRLVKYLPKMLKKRKHVKSTRLVPEGYVRSMIIS